MHHEFLTMSNERSVNGQTRYWVKTLIKNMEKLKRQLYNLLCLLRTTQSKLAAEIFFPQSYGDFKQSNILETWFFIWLGEKMLIFDHMIDIRDEPVQPGPIGPDPTWPSPTRIWRSLTGYFTVSSQDTKVSFQHDSVTGFEISVSNFELKIFFFFKYIDFLVKMEFCLFSYFFAYNAWTT